MKKGYFLAAIVAIAIVGCGESDDSGVTVETGALAKSQFIKQADKICEKELAIFERKIAAFLKENEGEPPQDSPKRAADALEAIIAPSFERQIEEVSDLGAPEGDEEQISSILISMQEALDRGRSDPLKFVNSKDPFASARKQAKEYGFQTCGVA